MDYLIAVQAPCRPLPDGSFATESAFAEHLRDLRDELGSRFERMVLAAPTDGAPPGAEVPSHLAILHPKRDGIHYLPLHPVGCSPAAFWTQHVPAVWESLRAAVRRAGVVHAGIACDVRRPVMALVDLAAHLEGRPIVFIVDIDFRRDTWMAWRTGLLSLRSYALTRLIQDPFRLAQLWLAPKYCALVLLKSGRMVAEVGRGAPHVRNFHDSALRAEHILSDDALEARVGALKEAKGPLDLVVFSRLVPYKGVDRVIEAVHRARQRGLGPLRLRILGEGEEQSRLERMIARFQLGDVVSMEPPVPHGASLFARIDDCHVMVATPLMEDSPRCAFDALGRGLPILAFDTQYYRDIRRESGGAVHTVRWPDVDALAQGMGELAAARPRLARMAQRGVLYARENTQRAWLQRRLQWTYEAMDAAALSAEGGARRPFRTEAGQREGHPPGNGARASWALG
jgi:glycosyltransferase involved in cell wall biosynthesis